MNMKYRSIFFTLAMVAFVAVAQAQTGVTIRLNATTHRTTVTANATQSYAIVDDGALGSDQRYSPGHDYWVTIASSSCSAPHRFSLVLDELDVAACDTLYIYDGVDTNARLLFALNNETNDEMRYQAIFVSSTNTTQSLTVRLRTADTTDGTHIGFALRAQCAIPCEVVRAVIDTFYYRLVDGDTVAMSYNRPAYEYDTIYDALGEFDHIDSVYHRGVNLCKGQDIVFVGHGEYSHYTDYYNPSDATSTFIWLMGLGGPGDTIEGVGLTRPFFDRYTEVGCYDVELYLEDEHGCRANNFEQVRVRISQNPIKTVFSLPAICQGDSTLVDVGYEGENARLILERLSFIKTVSKVNDSRTFIPDGPNCPEQCYEAPVLFTEFPQGRTLLSGEDICSICINYEHSFMGDYRLSIKCPNGQTAVLKYAATGYDPNIPAGAPEGSYGGSGTYTGYPYGGSSDGSYDGSYGEYCDSVYNMYGIGLDYCFSRNPNYTLVDGRSADQPAFRAASPTYLGSSGYTIQIQNYQFDVIPQPFSRAGQQASNSTFSTKKPSDHENKLDYYTPYSDFSELIGCPLNGLWSIEVCDYWSIDNGWVFSWGMDLCNVQAGASCEYQVPIDSIAWVPDPNHSDYATGRYRGLEVSRSDAASGYIGCPDTAGLFPLLMYVYDGFGCVWDTVTSITIVRKPEPMLGNDTVLCNVQTMVLDATDRFTVNEDYTYVWEPTGESTATINTMSNTGADITYSVEVMNHYPTGLTCYNRDTIVVRNSVTPIPNFDADKYPLEGCEPYTVNLTNRSLYGDHYRWLLDDTVYTDRDITHTFMAGSYDIRYYVYSDGGCVDSLIYPALVTVFSSPHANFNWDPVYPTVTAPSINLINQTEPALPDNVYFWEIQYDPDNPYSFHTLTTTNPTFRWESADGNVSGSYIIRLIARTDNTSLSGNTYQCADTAESTILLVNDFLQFPNVVTPNGDGINDRFVITNLVNGYSYPINILDIYNRWGTRVYHKENISSEDDFWDPSDMPAGTYYYRFRAQGFTGNIDHNGVVEVIK